VREVYEPGGVECGIASVWWEGEWQAACYEAVERGVEVAVCVSVQPDSLGKMKETYRVAELISPDNDTGASSFCSPRPSMACSSLLGNRWRQDVDEEVLQGPNDFMNSKPTQT